MESPAGFSSDIWIKLQEKLSKLTRVRYKVSYKPQMIRFIWLSLKVCIYDRAGLGMSERPAQLPQNATDDSKTRAKINHGQEFTLERLIHFLNNFKVVKNCSYFFLIGWSKI